MVALAALAAVVASKPDNDGETFLQLLQQAASSEPTIDTAFFLLT